MPYWDYVAEVFMIGIFGHIFISPILKELAAIREASQHTTTLLSKLSEELEISRNNKSRSEYFQKYGTYPDHWEKFTESHINHASSATQHLQPLRPEQKTDSAVR
jgi:hypothetical protein